MRALAVLSALAMLASLFFAWVNPGIAGISFAPLDLVAGLKPEPGQIREFFSAAPFEVSLFIASFALAALFLVLTLFNLPSRLLALAGGAIGIGLTGLTIWRMSKGSLKNPLPPEIGMNDGGAVLKFMAEALGTGAWAWLGGTVLLFLCGLTGFVRR